MGNLFFSPSGRIDSQTFLKFGLLFSVISVILFWFLVVLKSIGSLGLIIFFLSLYPWFCLWAKRLRGGEKSPALMVLYLVLFVIITLCFYLVAMLFLSGANFGESMMAAANSEITTQEQMEQVREMMNNIEPATILRNILVSFLLGSILTVIIGDRAIANNMESE